MTHFRFSLIPSRKIVSMLLSFTRLPPEEFFTRPRPVFRNGKTTGIGGS